MSVIVVAGGFGDMGKAVVGELLEMGKHEVYVMSRRSPPDFNNSRVSPLTSKTYSPLLKTDYSSDKELVQLLERHNVDTVICSFSMDFDSVSQAQLALIRAAEAASCVKRFIPTEFNVDYDLPDDVLPYPSKHYHAVARRELEKTSLEYSYIYCGLFMDYFGMPNIPGNFRALYLVVDPANRAALVPGDGNTKMVVSHTADVAYYIAHSVEIKTWPKEMTAIGSRITCNELVETIERNLGAKLEVTFQPVESLLENKSALLPSNEHISQEFPGGAEQVKSLTACLEAAIALGAYDFVNTGEQLDLIARFSDQRAPTKIEDFLAKAWGKN